MSVSAARVASVTLALLGVGAFCGAVVGGLALVVQVHPLVPPIAAGLRHGARLRLEAREFLFLFTFGATFGVAVGAVIAPIVGWLFLRRVALARAIGQTALGSLVGIAVAAILHPTYAAPFALAGLLVAAIRLWIVAARGRVERHSFATR